MKAGVDVVIVPTCWYATDIGPVGLKHDPDGIAEAQFVSSMVVTRAYEHECCVVFVKFVFAFAALSSLPLRCARSCGGKKSDGFLGRSSVAMPLKGALASIDGPEEDMKVVEVDLSVLPVRNIVPVPILGSISCFAGRARSLQNSRRLVYSLRQMKYLAPVPPVYQSKNLCKACRKLLSLALQAHHDGAGSEEDSYELLERYSSPIGMSPSSSAWKNIARRSHGQRLNHRVGRARRVRFDVKHTNRDDSERGARGRPASVSHMRTSEKTTRNEENLIDSRRDTL